MLEKIVAWLFAGYLNTALLVPAPEAPEPAAAAPQVACVDGIPREVGVPRRVELAAPVPIPGNDGDDRQ